MNSRKTERKNPKRPFAPLYWFAIFVMNIYFKLAFHLSTKADRELINLLKNKGPMLVLYNHESNYDFLMVANALKPVRLNFMVTTYYFHHTMLAKLLRFMGCIPKKQFVPDVRAMKDVMSVIKRGGSVAIAPEGQVCYSGATCAIDMSIAKLVKKLRVPVAVVKLRGNHLAIPKWGKGGKYPAASECRASLLYTAEQIDSLSVEDIEKDITDAISFNEYEWQRERMAKSRKPRMAAGLDHVLWRCPDCGDEFRMKSDGALLTCEGCGYSVRMNDYGFFERDGDGPVIFDNAAAWYESLRSSLREELKNGVFPETCECTLSRTVEGKIGYELCGEGVMTLNSEGLWFEGVRDGEPFSVSALFSHQSALPFSGGSWAIDIHGEDENYALTPKNTRFMMKYVEAYTEARKLFELKQ